MIGSDSDSLGGLATLRPVAFCFPFVAGIFVSTALSLLTRGFRWYVFFVPTGSGSTAVAAAAFVRALVVLVVVGGTSRVLVEVRVAAVNLLAIALGGCSNEDSGNACPDACHYHMIYMTTHVFNASVYFFKVVLILL